MQFVIVAFSALLVIYQAQSAPSEDFLSQLKAIKESCKTDDPAKDEEIFANVWAMRSLPSSDTENCYMACLMKNMGALIDGKLNAEVFEMISENRWSEATDVAKAKEIDEKCLKQVETEGKNECTVAHAILECFFEESKKAELKP